MGQSGSEKTYPCVFNRKECTKKQIGVHTVKLTESSELLLEKVERRVDLDVGLNGQKQHRKASVRWGKESRIQIWCCLQSTFDVHEQ
jgi:hypothetical protein